jgi:hypothetical protein
MPKSLSVEQTNRTAHCQTKRTARCHENRHRKAGIPTDRQAGRQAEKTIEENAVFYKTQNASAGGSAMLAANLSDLLQGPARRERPHDCTYRLASSARSSLVRGPPSLYFLQSWLLRFGPVSATRSCLKNRGNRARRAHAQRAGVQVQ